ncbi:MAG: hypothetical protein EHM12_08300 [Dehalococcoidia bacterium]|nr:MAG: hypothetical protein EHM12_08300 [Dehalococcoidia bacterium]
MNNSDSDIGVAVSLTFVFVCFAALVFCLGFVFGNTSGEVKGEKNTAIITVQALNKIKQQIPKGTKISNPFTQEQLDTLGYDAQDILKLSDFN